ncbi:hypothetical protein [Actinomadura sp. CNU-125]|uniref:hypothetical protein n=1 Tax=Actinomadura sp. CNU-125 TaxID=1904961 RepID=UPI001300F8C3|nr:hypothetical protein [Actinomadura sp. CNU-125]
MADRMPADPVTDLAAMAVQLHEVYELYVAAGFTGAQAMQMVCTIIAASMGASP